MSASDSRTGSPFSLKPANCPCFVHIQRIPTTFCFAVSLRRYSSVRSNSRYRIAYKIEADEPVTQGRQVLGKTSAVGSSPRGRVRRRLEIETERLGGSTRQKLRQVRESPCADRTAAVLRDIVVPFLSFGTELEGVLAAQVVDIVAEQPSGPSASLPALALRPFSKI
jgi:hypothetical protein